MSHPRLVLWYANQEKRENINKMSTRKGYGNGVKNV